MTDSDLNRDDLSRDDLNRDDLNRDRTWLITGAGRGIGRALTEAALVAGERVIATVRDPDVLAQLTIRHRDRLQVGLLDVRNRAAVADIVAAALTGAAR